MGFILTRLSPLGKKGGCWHIPSLHLNSAPDLKGKETLVAFSNLERPWPAWVTCPFWASHCARGIGYSGWPAYVIHPLPGQGNLSTRTDSPMGPHGWGSDGLFRKGRAMEPHTTCVVYCRLIPAFKGIPRIPQEERNCPPHGIWCLWRHIFLPYPVLSSVISKVAQALFRGPRNHTKAWRKKKRNFWIFWCLYFQFF